MSWEDACCRAAAGRGTWHNGRGGGRRQGRRALAAEAATKKVSKVWAVEHDLLDAYTADGYTIALEQLIKKASPQPVLFAHTYRTRDFAPKLATRFAGCSWVT